MRFTIPAIPGRAAATLIVRSLAVAGVAALLGGCNTTGTTARDTTGSIPRDYRSRHPITIKEASATLELFVGAGRGGLTPSQRAEVLAYAQTWKREATGGVTIERPVGAANERAASDSLQQTLSILAAAGVPHEGIGIRPYQPPGHDLSTLRLSYPRMVAKAGPCGLWPDDLGPSYDRTHFENSQYYNFGCATQRNLAAQLDNPADLIQPRGETPAYSAKRSTGLTKWRSGQSPATVYPDNKGAISDLGK
jgi:pilus assembly protein CpaD